MNNKVSYVIPYSIDDLVGLFSTLTPSSCEIVSGKIHKVYFEEYFGAHGVNAKTIVVEREYVDRDYLEDYAAYYVKCFHDYERLCSRLHFFSHAFSEDEFERLLSGGTGPLTPAVLRDTYLGFIVVKHLPRFIIGRTCLKTYDDDGGRRQFPIKRIYRPILFGLQLEVETLPFQEQDRAAAACATSSLWTAFQGTGILFNHPIPSPVEITRAASKYIPSGTRTFPNQGLSILQMAEAIRQVGLDPLLVNLEAPTIDKNTLIETAVYPYLKGGIPVLMGFTIPSLGDHAVTITGYSLGTETRIADDIVFRWSRMDKLYAHDDQIGPFARMVFDAKTGNLDSSWKNENGEHRQSVTPTTLLIPLYHKIRVPVERVIKAVMSFSGNLNIFRDLLKEKCSFPSDFNLEWDVYLTTTNNLKTGIVSGTSPGGDCRSEILRKSLPKYLWRATALFKSQPILDLLFDATDLESGKTFIGAIENYPQLSRLLRYIPMESLPADMNDDSRDIFRSFGQGN